MEVIVLELTPLSIISYKYRSASLNRIIFGIKYRLSLFINMTTDWYRQMNTQLVTNILPPLTVKFVFFICDEFLRCNFGKCLLQAWNFI